MTTRSTTNRTADADRVVELWGLSYRLGTIIRLVACAPLKKRKHKVEDLELAIAYLQQEIAKVKARASTNEIV